MRLIGDANYFMRSVMSNPSDPSGTTPEPTALGANGQDSPRIREAVTSVRRRPVFMGTAAALVLAAAAAVWAGIDGLRIEVPDLQGLTPVAAVEQVEAANLVAHSAGDDVPDSLTEFTGVVHQEPAAGVRVSRGHTVVFRADLVDVSVPDVTGETLADAKAALANAGLAGRDTHAQVRFAGDGSSGIADDVDPVAVVDALRELIGVDVRVDGASDVEVIVEPFEFSGGESSAWEVTAVHPAPGTSVVAGTEVEITLALPLVQVPDVAGLSRHDATAKLEDLGLGSNDDAQPHVAVPGSEGFTSDLAVLRRSYWGGRENDRLERMLDDDGLWTVHEQSVAPGALVLSGEQVTLTTAWPTATVPDVTGMSVNELYEALNSVGLAAHRGIDGGTSGVVHEQLVTPGTEMPMGASVGTRVGHEVTFRVTSTVSRGTVTWIRPESFSVEQAGDTALPWSQSWILRSRPARHERGNFSVQMRGNGTVTCEIVVNGEVVSTSTSSGPFAIASCN